MATGTAFYPRLKRSTRPASGRVECVPRFANPVVWRQGYGFALIGSYLRGKSSGCGCEPRKSNPACQNFTLVAIKPDLTCTSLPRGSPFGAPTASTRRHRFDMAPVGVPVRVRAPAADKEAIHGKKEKRERGVSLDLGSSERPQREDEDRQGGIDEPDTPGPFGSPPARSPLPKRLKMRLERQDLPAEDIAARVDARLAAAERKREVRARTKKRACPAPPESRPSQHRKKTVARQDVSRVPEPKKTKTLPRSPRKHLTGLGDALLSLTSHPAHPLFAGGGARADARQGQGSVASRAQSRGKSCEAPVGTRRGAPPEDGRSFREPIVFPGAPSDGRAAPGGGRAPPRER